ncbi:MAG: UDP-glucose/GDP-mannose dehydrogenase family protein [Actinomycetota bacterium]
MRIAVFGTGYVGLTTGACLAELGNTVTCVDIDKEKIDRLKQGDIPFYEPGLEELVLKNTKANRLFFETDGAKALEKSEIIFIAVGTPSDAEGKVDLSQVIAVAETISKNIKEYKVIVDKSTVPPGTGGLVKGIISRHYSGEFDVVSNPEFLREGSAIHDFMHPDWVVIGNSLKRAQEIMLKLYEPLNCPIVLTDVETAEMIKYASNAYLATSISFINSIANICEKVGADVEKVAEGMRYDKRIGKHAFLSAGVGYGGSCFPKDVKALLHIAKENKVDFDLLQAVEEVNQNQRQVLLSKIESLVSDLSKATIGVWGLAFKPRSDDMREAPSVMIIQELQKSGAKIKAYDPVAEVNAKKILKEVEYYPSPLKAVENCDALVILTEWDEFRNIDKGKVKSLLKHPNIIDGRNIYNPAEMKKLGFNYASIGR